MRAATSAAASSTVATQSTTPASVPRSEPRRRTKSAQVADIFLQVKPGKDFELLWALRALVKGRRVRPDIAQITGVPLATLEDLVARMKACNYGVLLFGMGLTMTRGRHFNSGALLALANDLNEFTHFVAKPVRGHGNVTGADNVVSWRTGFPFGVNFSRGYPRFNPGEFTTVDLLSKGDADAAMIIVQQVCRYNLKIVVRGVGKRASPVDFTQRPDPGYRGLQLIVDRDEPELVQLDTGGLNA